MALLWSTKRKALYSSGIGLVLLIGALVLYGFFFIQAPTCFDGKQNGNEAGVDCGGSCALLCRDQVRAPVVKWVRAFPVSSTTYAAVAYIDNTNGGVGARSVPYIFQLFDDKNQFVTEKEGVIDIPPIHTLPVIESFIEVGNRTVARAHFLFSQQAQDIPWKRIPERSFPTITLSDQHFSTDTHGTRLSVLLHNDTLSDIKNSTVAAVLFDADGVARAASQSRVAVIAHRSTQTVVFTWPQQLPDIKSEEITVVPSF